MISKEVNRKALVESRVDTVPAQYSRGILKYALGFEQRKTTRGPGGCMHSPRPCFLADRSSKGNKQQQLQATTLLLALVIVPLY